MPEIAIVTDTDSSIPTEIADRYGIIQVPINLYFGDETFRAVYDIDDAGLFERIDRTGEFPSASAPSPGQFAEAYEKAFSSGANAIVCLTVSSEVSATYSAAVQAKEMFPERTIEVVDTRGVSMAEGFMVLAAAEAVQGGADVDQIVAYASETGERAHVYVALSTLKYLAMSGRVPSLTAGVAGLLNLRPILTLRDGKLDLLERVRTEKRAWNRLIERVVEALDGKPVERLALLHINALEAVRKFEALLRENLACPEEVIIAPMTPGLSIFGGSGMVGLTVVSA